MTGPPGVAAFDFDGTLVAGDSLHRFLARLIGPVRFYTRTARAALPMALAYGRHGRDGSKRVLLARSVSGLAVEAVEAAGREFGAELAGRIRPELAQWMAWHDGRGHRRVLVSASLAVYLEPFGRLTGFDHVIATRLACGPDGRLTGQLDGDNVRAHEKARRLRQLLGPEPVELWAYGDSAGDREMLAMAQHPTMVGRRPSPPPVPVPALDGTDWGP